GARVIVDDVFYFFEPFFADGIIAQAADQVVSQGVPYFSSAGNQARQSYASGFQAGPVFTQDQFPRSPRFFRGPPHQLRGGDVFQRITIPQSATLNLILNWDSPYFSVSGGAGTPNDLDVYLFDAAQANVVAGAAFDNAGGDPIENFSFTNHGATADFNIMIV